MCQGDCQVPVRRFPSPSRSIHFGDVAALAARNNEAHGLGNREEVLYLTTLGNVTLKQKI